MISVFIFIIVSYSSPSFQFKFPVQIVSETKDSHSWAFDIGDDFSCVALKDCATFSWLLNYNNVQNEFIQIKLLDIVEFLKKKRCAIKDHKSNKKVTLKTRIACPNLIEDSYTIADDRDGFGDYDEECTIDISHGESGSLLESLRTTRIFEHVSKTRRNLTSFEGSHILHLTSHGGCCWKLYSTSNKEGIETTIEQGASTYPIFQPKSIKSSSC